MRIFGWVQSKFNGRQGKRFEVGPSSSHYTTKQNTCREEFNDWPQTFLAIGTFGNNEMHEESQIAQSASETQESSNEISDLNIEEIKLQKEISKLLNLKRSSSTDGAGTDDSDDYKITLNKIKDLLSDNHNGIRQRSLSFLLKKMFIGRSGLSTQQSLRDPIPESKLEKILRKIIHKRIHPQTVSRPPTMSYSRRNTEEEKVEEGCKWVKTDSEYIVLEI